MSRRQKVMSAECVNLLARFVQIARQEEGVDIHLQDKDIFEKADQIAEQTSRADLQEIHHRLMQERKKSALRRASATEMQGASQLDRVAKFLGLR